MGTVIESVRQFIIRELAPADVGEADVGLHSSLIEDEIIDSLGIYSIVSFLSEEHGVDVSDDDITIENFETLAALEQLVNRLRGDNVS